MALQPTDVTHFATAGEFRRWLRAHHAESEALWVGYWKKATGRKTITWEESVDEALCFGWIDGVRKGVDEESYAIRFTPRRRTSIWSRRNVERYVAMERAGRVFSSGAEAYAARRENRSGVYSFEQGDPVELPAEYLARLKARAEAFADWEARPPGYRRQVAHWIMGAKREETRLRRLHALIEDGAAGRKVKPLRR